MIGSVVGRVAVLVAVALGLFGSACSRPSPPPGRKLVILAVDGLDHGYVESSIAAGRLPNLAALATRGGFVPLATSEPPQSPVAWSDFLTGHHADAHGIYDFVHRDPSTRAPYLSTSRAEPAPMFSLGPWEVPLGSGRVELLRDEPAFWEHLAAYDHTSTIYKVPASYPPPKSEHARVLAGMGTPDLRGTYGTFTAFASDSAITAGPRPGGELVTVDVDDRGRVRSRLRGPAKSNGEPSEAEVVFRIDPVADHDQVIVEVGDARQLLRAGEWGAFLPVAFNVGSLAPSVPGMVRFYVRSVRPHLYVYASPVNIDPLDPAQPVTSEPDYVASLAGDLGRFYTQGMAEDTKALEAGLLTDDEFLTQAGLVFDEDAAALRWHLEHDRSELLFFYLSSIDQVGHMFWRGLEGSAVDRERFGHVMPELYGRVDALVGDVLTSLDPETTLIVMSDHGFTAWRWEFHLNAWLAKRGYLTVREDVAFRSGSWDHIDWSQTKAYGVGINQLFVNQVGREAGGIVPEHERDQLATEIGRALLDELDPVTGNAPVSRVVVPAPGRHADRRPDLIVLYGDGYRNSDASAIGAVGSAVITENRKKWSGDHCIDPAIVPGVLLSSRPLARQEAALIDMTPSILDLFGVPVPSALPGRSVWSSSSSDRP